jgi:biopolymer transport protein ExbD
MAMTVGNDATGEAEEEVISAINTTPLVDVMLVLLIIFLITIPVVVQQVPLELPKERNVVTQTKPENIVIAVNKDGDVFWNLEYVRDSKALFEKLKPVAVMVPQPEIHIRADAEARYESVGRVVATCQRASIAKIGFITEPPARSLAGG